MKLTFTVNKQRGEVAVPDSDEFTVAFEEVHAAILAACGAGTPDRFLQARVTDGLREALFKGKDVELGEVLSPM